MKESIILELDQDILSKLLDKSKSENLSISSLVSAVLSWFFKSGGSIDFASYPGRPINTNLDEYLKEIEKHEIERALNLAKSKTHAAELLGISFRSFRYRCSEQKIEMKD